MGYVTRFYGEIRIEPPIPWGSIKNSPFLPDTAKQRDGRDLKFVIDEQHVDTDKGTLVMRRAVALVSAWEDDARGYHIVEHLQEVVDTHPWHQFTGRLDCYGEDNVDIWRLQVIDGKATRVEPQIVWPDDESTQDGGS